MRTYRFMFSDNFNGIQYHTASDLVNRKSIIMSFLQQKPRRANGRNSAATRLGNQFVHKLKGLGLK